MIASDNGSLQDCPKSFDSICMQALSRRKFTQTMANRNVCEVFWICCFVVHNVIALKIICHNNCIGFCNGRNYRQKLFTSQFFTFLIWKCNTGINSSSSTFFDSDYWSLFCSSVWLILFFWCYCGEFRIIVIFARFSTNIG